jgi:UPF0755 protein
VTDFRASLRKALLYASLTIILAGGWSLWAFLSRSEEASSPFLMTVAHGASFRSVIVALSRKGAIASPETVIFWSDLLGLARSIQEGEYEISPGDRPYRILWNLFSGQKYYQKLTVPEGFTITQVAARMHRLGIGTMDQNLGLMSDRAFLAQLHIPSTSLEGYLFPNTYYFSRGSSSREVLEMMVSRFWKVMIPEWQERLRRQGFTINQGVTLASIVQKEAGTVTDMPMIAGVFLNRLRQGMKIQSDPTVLYVLPTHHHLIAKDLKIDSSYNTYLYSGLPPTPISNPGIEAIRSVIFPKDVPYLYFVSDGHGAPSLFSRTLEEHDRAIRRMMRKSRQTENQGPSE